jgi:membrane protease YdiL (CAAX protease family)
MIEVVRAIGWGLFAGGLFVWLMRHREDAQVLSLRYVWRAFHKMDLRAWSNLFLRVCGIIFIASLIIPLVADVTADLTRGPLIDPSEHPVPVLIRNTPWFVVFVSLTILPVFEEWVFRGIVLERLKHRGVFRAAFISAFGFGLVHLLNTGTHFWAFVPPVVMGFLLGWIYLHDGLKGSILAHSGFNGFQFILLYLV